MDLHKVTLMAISMLLCSSSSSAAVDKALDPWDQNAAKVIVESASITLPKERYEAWNARGLWALEKMGSKPSNKSLNALSEAAGIFSARFTGDSAIGDVIAAFDVGSLDVVRDQRATLRMIYSDPSFDDVMSSCEFNADTGQSTVCQLLSIASVSSRHKPGKHAVGSAGERVFGELEIYRTIIAVAEAIQSGEEVQNAPLSVSTEDTSINTVLLKQGLMGASVHLRSILKVPHK